MPSLVVAPVATSLGDAFDFFLSSSDGMRPFFLALNVVFPFLNGEMYDISSQRHFSPITTPFAAEVDSVVGFILLDPSPVG